MPPRKWIDRNAATTYRLVHRPQNDPLIHDADAGDMVFAEQLPPQAAKKGLTLSDLTSEYSSYSKTGSSSVAGGQGKSSARDHAIRDNEGEAAEYGVYYDDTDYDYMQHLRDLGADGEGRFIEASAAPVTVKSGKNKGKEAVSLDEALRQLDLEHATAQAQQAGKLVDEAILPSRNLRHYSYQDQQDVPDALAGFQPDMDPRLREALEALEDEAYVDNEDQDLFDVLAGGAEEIEDEEFEDSYYDYEEGEGGYESDDTAKPAREYREESTESAAPAETAPHRDTVEPSASQETPSALPPSDAAIPDAASDPFAAFNAHKAEQKASGKNPRADATPSTASAIRDSRMHAGAAASTIMSNASFLSRSGRKKRKGALTNPSAYSMTSSALHRNEGLTTLDRRFDRILETEYEEDEDGAYDDADGDGDGAETASVATGVTGMTGMSAASGWSTTSSQAPQLVRRDYSGVMGAMDEFLMGHGGGPAQKGDSRASTRKGGKTRRGYGGQTGMQQLDEIRKDLGRPKIKA